MGGGRGVVDSLAQFLSAQTWFKSQDRRAFFDFFFHSLMRLSCRKTVEKVYMKYGTASKITFDQQSSSQPRACASAQFEQDLCNRKNHVRSFCLALTHSSTGPAYGVFFFFCFFFFLFFFVFVFVCSFFCFFVFAFF